MNSINSNNCEAWMLDYFEGNLSSSQSKELMRFLESHPEWQKDFDEYAGNEEAVELSPLPAAGEEASLIAAKTADPDEDLIALTEGLLSDADSARLMRQISTDDELAADYAIYQKTRLKPDHEILFADKNKLKKKAVIIPLVLRYSAVAAMLCGALVAVWLYNYNSPEKQKMAQENAISKSANDLKTDQFTEKIVPQQEDVNQLSGGNSDQISKPETSVPVNSESKESVTSGYSNSNNSTSPKDRQPEHLIAEHRSEVALEPIESRPIAEKLFTVTTEHTLPENISDAPPSAVVNEWNEAEQSNGIAGLINTIGKNILGKVKEATDEQIVIEKQIEQQNETEEELYTSTFKLGSFEVYRSRAKK